MHMCLDVRAHVYACMNIHVAIRVYTCSEYVPKCLDVKACVCTCMSTWTELFSMWDLGGLVREVSNVVKWGVGSS